MGAYSFGWPTKISTGHARQVIRKTVLFADWCKRVANLLTPLMTIVIRKNNYLSTLFSFGTSMKFIFILKDLRSPFV